MPHLPHECHCSHEGLTDIDPLCENKTSPMWEHAGHSALKTTKISTRLVPAENESGIIRVCYFTDKLNAFMLLESVLHFRY